MKRQESEQERDERRRKWLAELEAAPKVEFDEFFIEKMNVPIGVSTDEYPIVEPKEFTDANVLEIKEIIESVYTDGIDSLSDLKRGNESITGIFTDGSDRFEFELTDDELIYGLIE